MKRETLMVCCAVLGAAFGGAAAPDVAFDLRAKPHADGTRSAEVVVGGVRSALPDGSSAVRGAAATGDGAHVFVVHGFGRYNLPATQLERGWINSSAMSVFDGATGRRINTVLLDDPQAGAANPWGVAVNADWIAVTHAGTHELSLIPRQAFLDAVLAAKDDLSADLGLMTRVGRRRIPFKGKGPRAVRFRADGTIEVRLHFAEATAVVDPATGVVVEPDLPGGVSAAVAADPVRLGEAWFHDASVCYQGWQSCASCHLDGRNDGLRWDFPDSGGGIGHPEETVDLSQLKALSPMCVKNSFRVDCLYEAPTGVVAAVEAYVRNMIRRK